MQVRNDLRHPRIIIFDVNDAILFHILYTISCKSINAMGCCGRSAGHHVRGIFENSADLSLENQPDWLARKLSIDLPCPDKIEQNGKYDVELHHLTDKMSRRSLDRITSERSYSSI